MRYLSQKIIQYFKLNFYNVQFYKKIQKFCSLVFYMESELFSSISCLSSLPLNVFVTLGGI